MQAAPPRNVYLPFITAPQRFSSSFPRRGQPAVRHQNSTHSALTTPPPPPLSRTPGNHKPADHLASFSRAFVPLVALKSAQPQQNRGKDTSNVRFLAQFRFFPAVFTMPKTPMPILIAVALLLAFPRQCSSFSNAARATPSLVRHFELYLRRPNMEKPLSMEPLASSVVAEGSLKNSGDSLAAEKASMGVVDAALLIAGNMVGAGMLALPETSKLVGFPTTVACLVGIWVAAQASAMAIAKVAEQSEGSGSFGAIAKEQLGRAGSVVVSGVNLMLNYMLLVAYTSQGAKLLHEALGGQQEALLCSCFAVFATSFTMAGNRVFEGISRAAMATMMLSFVSIVAEKVPQVDQSLIVASAPANDFLGDVGSALPIFLVSMVFHNCLPVISAQLREGRAKAPAAGPGPSWVEKNPMAAATLLGSAIPLLMYIVYDACILGAAQPEAFPPVEAMFSQTAALSALSSGSAVWVFSMTALLTSFWGTIVSQVEELKTLLRTAASGSQDWTRRLRGDGDTEALAAHALCLVPPTVISTCYPDAFFDALRGAALFGDLSLYFLLPVGLLFVLKK